MNPHSTAAPGGATLRGVRVWIALWTVYVVWGSTYLGIRYMVETLPALLGSGMRFLLVPAREAAACAVPGIALLLGGNGLVAISENAGTPSGIAALVFASVPLWVVLFRALAGERVSRTAALWVGAGFVGVALLLLPGERPDDAPIGGILVVVAGAFFWASGSFASGRLPLPRDPIVSTSWQLVLGGGTMTLVGLVAGDAGELDLAAVSWRSAAGFAYLVVFGSLVAFFAYTWVLQHAPISQVATYAYVNPVVAIALGALLVGEELTPLVVIAAAVIVASVAGTVRSETQRPAVTTPAGGPAADSVGP
jgi:drug/metabolite transporter (DMT)-like permease